MEMTEPDDPFVIRTFTGRLVNPFDLTPDDIDIIDIAVALSHINRFNGHTLHTLPVDQHCIEVSQIVEQSGSTYAMEGLLHDASEAYLCDIPSPVKRQPGMWAYREAEDKAHRAIAERFVLNYSTGGFYKKGWPSAVHLADAGAYRRDCERRFAPDPPPRHGDFLDRYQELGGVI
jgi:hypothetical protein